MKRVFGLLVLALIATQAAFGAQPEQPNTRWYVTNGSDTVIVFVHGILANSVDCWTARNRTYWPNLVRDDRRFGSPDIYLGGYYTAPASGLFRISDAADELYSFMSTPDASGRAPPLKKQHLLFVAHSTGGLVVRQMLLRHIDEFKDKTIGLALMASPSRGSNWANRLEGLRKVAGNQMAAELQRGNSYTDELDRSFADLVYKHKIPKLVGVDAFESKFIVRSWVFFTDDYIVSAQNTGSYFGSYKVLSDTDHFSIVKPDGTSHASHQLLVEFFVNTFDPERRRTVQEARASVDYWGLPRSSTGRKLYQARIRPVGEMDEGTFNDQWSEAVFHSINKVLSDTLVYAPTELSFEGYVVFPRTEPRDLEELLAAGRELNALAVTLTSAQIDADANKLVARTYFRPLMTAPDGFIFPPIEDSMSASRFGPVVGGRALSKYWGYYVLLALANRCLALRPDQATCDRTKLTDGLQRALRGLGSNDTALMEQITHLIEKSRRPT